ncbi:MAG: hypothetical protein JW940_26190 [Polyangiaceae bacterium]|nr:hypothetical protein [Polyangiaceae bacterium]
MIPDTRRLILVESGHFKVAAAARLAEGGTEALFEASVLFHAAARAERRALEATEAPTPEDRLRSAVEVCGCLIDALDPSAVLEWAWGRVLEASEPLPETEARAIRARLDGKFGSFLRSYQRVLKHTPKTASAMERGKAPEQARELGILLSAFPGDPRFWSSLASVQRTNGNVRACWDAIQRARRLDPEDTAIRQAELDLVTQADPEQASAVLEVAYRDILADGNADLCFGFAAGATRWGLERGERVWLERALDAATLGMSFPPLYPSDRAWFHAFRLVIRELLAGKKPRMDILFRAGLGAWVVASREKDPLRVLFNRSSLLRAA